MNQRTSQLTTIAQVPSQPLDGCFVTGTDTGVGKTRVAAALIRGLVRAGWTCAGFKPVAAGMDRVESALVNHDVSALHQVSSPGLSRAELGPFQFRTACAPQIAAALDSRTIERDVILQGARALRARFDKLVVEGVGGFCVPLGTDYDSADLAVDLGLPVVMVVGLRLGCLNHALLTAECVRARGLRLVGWVGNRIEAEFPHELHNLAALAHELTRRHGAPCLGRVGRLAVPHAKAVAAQLDQESLTGMFGVAPVHGRGVPTRRPHGDGHSFKNADFSQQP